MLDARVRFSATAALYDRYRPSYPTAAIDWIIETAGVRRPGPVADIGCGTGIVARLFSARGYDVTGVDPNSEMLAYADRQGGARYVRGEATATGLPSGVIGLVTVAQAFHWFEVAPTLSELGRILRQGGRCAVFWNLRADTALLTAYERLLEAHCAGREEVPRAAAAIDALTSSPAVVDVERAAFGYTQPLDRAGLFGRVYSSSYVMHGVRDRARFDADLEALFEAHANSGNVSFEYRTVVLVFRIAR